MRSEVYDKHDESKFIYFIYKITNTPLHVWVRHELVPFWAIWLQAITFRRRNRPFKHYLFVNAASFGLSTTCYHASFYVQFNSTRQEARGEAVNLATSLALAACLVFQWEIKNQGCLDVTSCRLVNSYRRFGRAWSPHFQDRSSWTLILHVQHPRN
jgi:hypothetical protein